MNKLFMFFMKILTLTKVELAANIFFIRKSKDPQELSSLYLGVSLVGLTNKYRLYPR